MPEAQTSRFRLDEVLAPVGDRRARDLPSLIRAASRLVWEAAPRQTLLTSGLQLVISAGFAAQLLVSRGLLTHLLAGRAHGYGSTIPYVAALAIIIAIVGMAASARGEIQRLLAELVGRYAMGRVIEASNSMDLLAFEVPEFHDRQQRALVSAASRPTQMTAGLAGLSGGLLSAAGISVALLAVQPLFLGLILIAFVPAWLATVAARRAMYPTRSARRPRVSNDRGESDLGHTRSRRIFTFRNATCLASVTQAKSPAGARTVFRHRALVRRDNS